MKKNNIIPIMTCFDKNYVLPASVAFYSLLENANSEYYYNIYILHSDITKKQQLKLKENIKIFANKGELIFINMNNRFDGVWTSLKSKVHFSKEVLYKLLVASLFPQYDKIIVTDVDVVFLGDISDSYFSIKNKDDYYLAGVKQIGFLRNFNSVYKDNFNNEEIKLLNGFCGGFLVMNLKKIRIDKLEDIFINYLNENADKIIYAEQDVLNICTQGKVKYLPLSYVTCTYMWDFFKTDNDFNTDPVYSEKELKYAMNNPIQLHYASTEKPWKYVDTLKSNAWFQYIVKTIFLDEFLLYLPNNIIIRKTPAPNSKLKNILSYLKNNPLFIFQKEFYNKILKKVKSMLK